MILKNNSIYRKTQNLIISFPFVGIIEHTNFEDKNEYGSHIVYLSKYIETSDQLFKMNKADFLKFSIKFIRKVFPEFNSEWIIKYDIWKSKYSQPIVVKNYSKLIPSMNTPYQKSFFILNGSDLS